jgi:hypothetical protein
MRWSPKNTVKVEPLPDASIDAFVASQKHRRVPRKPGASEGDILTQSLQTLKLFKSVKAWRCNSGTVKVGARYVHLAPKGTPDIVGYIAPSGRMFGIEIKSDTGKVKPAQREWMNGARAAGVLVAVCRTAQEVAHNLKTWIKDEASQWKR